jgi:hypothetical protein
MLDLNMFWRTVLCNLWTPIESNFKVEIVHITNT